MIQRPLVCAAFFLLLSVSAHADTVKILAEDDWYPYTANIDGTSQGITVDLVDAIFAAEGHTAEYESVNYDKAMGLVKDGVALACFNAPRTEELEDVYLWHDQPLTDAVGGFYAVADYSGSIAGVAGAAGKTVGLTLGYGYGNDVDMDMGMFKEYSKSDRILVQKLLANRMELIILFDRVADYLLPKLGVAGKLKKVGSSGTIQNYVAFSKKHPDGKKYLEIFNRGFKKIREDGTYGRILAKWDAKLKATAPETTPAA